MEKESACLDACLRMVMMMFTYSICSRQLHQKKPPTGRDVQSRLDVREN